MAEYHWTSFPTGRWAASVLSHGGCITLHAWVGGEWAVTRGQSSLRAGDPFVIGSREEGQPTGSDLHEAMHLAESAANAVIENERIAHQGFDLTLCEIDKDYFEAGKKRLADHQSAPRLFEMPKNEPPEQLSLLDQGTT